jgi:rubrerythrin
MGTKPHRRTRGRAIPEDEGAMQDVDAQRDDATVLEFAVTGTDVAGEFRCADCGYGAVLRRALPLCPMCGGASWESRAPRRVD